ncbi:SWIM zinc finger family protein [Phytohabitans sp. ZYX-F-186]|uniref:SWIM zinc finger family protein n=1 Tax=Phytohabitans maris TaxID=3071409 RepID=A0ABU0ZKA3_9ACTN|nr:SWIM zinc finger family protein [Phytohabitans sp. ZYX-F-186]MDQ7906819.1 SWIM zinc finger family protein [Phytohabitans sp. ZYX-F-186]
MPIERWSTAQVLALAPDASSSRAAQGVSAATKWEAAGRDGDVLWGLCRGSGKHPYQACVDLTEPAYRCSCPSRKFPCKHALGLMLMWAAGGAPDAAAPDWVAEWRAARSSRSRPAAAPKGPPDEAAARKRAEQRADRITAGLDELDRWLTDQVAHGLAGAERSGYGPYEAMAARLVDAQAPGAANAVRRLGRVAGVGQHWADRLLGELALLRLLVAAYGRLGELPAPLAATVRSRVGIPVPSEEVLAGPRVRDRWYVLGQVDLADERLATRRTWLHGEESGRFALLLTFVPIGQAFPADAVPGMILDADLCWHPGNLPMRALVAQRHAVRQPEQAPAGAVGVAAALAGWSAAVAAEPWCENVPMLLGGVTLTDDGHVVDRAGDALPLSAGHDQPWWLLAASGGRPATIAGEYGPGGFRPLAAWPDGRFVPAPIGPTGDRRGPLLPPDLLSAALVGTERRPYSGGAIGGVLLDGAGPAGLLEGAAVALAYARAGVSPVPDRVPIEPAPEETSPQVPAAAAHRLTLLLSDGGVPGGTEVALGLLGDWLAHAADLGYRVPPELLPALLDTGRRRTALRPALASVAGRRASWLATRRADWRYLLTEAAADPDPQDWATGTPGQRLAYLTALRAADPAAGLALLSETFDAEDPDDRARLLGALATGLGRGDEPLLERALDDRRKEVRSVAADLLSALPGSALRQRMAERALACVRIERRALGRDRLVVTPPGECDVSMRRDGVQAKPARGIGPQAWLLEEILARTPLDTWTTAFERPADRVLALPVADDWGSTLHKGLARAAVVQRDPAWVTELADEMSRPVNKDLEPYDEALTAQLYEALPPDELARYAARALGRDPIRAHRLLAMQTGPWPDDLAVAVLDAIKVLAGGERHAWHIGELCRTAAPSMPVRFADRVAALAEALHATDPPTRQAIAVAQLASALTFRREMYEELR